MALANIFEQQDVLFLIFENLSVNEILLVSVASKNIRALVFACPRFYSVSINTTLKERKQTSTSTSYSYHKVSERTHRLLNIYKYCNFFTIFGSGKIKFAPQFTDKLPHIKKLHISNCEIDDSFYSLLRLCENIVELKIDLPPNEVRKIEQNSIVFVDSLCTMANLHVLEVTGWVLIEDELIDLLNGCSLTSIAFSYSCKPSFWPNVLSHVQANKLAILTSINVNGIGIGNTDVCELAKLLPHLTRLEFVTSITEYDILDQEIAIPCLYLPCPFDASNDYSPKMEVFLKKHKGLQEFSMQVRDERIMKCLQEFHGSRLTFLTVQFRPGNYELDALVGFFSQLNNLKKLSIWSEVMSVYHPKVLICLSTLIMPHLKTLYLNSETSVVDSVVLKHHTLENLDLKKLKVVSMNLDCPNLKNISPPNLFLKKEERKLFYQKYFPTLILINVMCDGVGFPIEITHKSETVGELQERLSMLGHGRLVQFGKFLDCEKLCTECFTNGCMVDFYHM